MRQSCILRAARDSTNTSYIDVALELCREMKSENFLNFEKQAEFKFQIQNLSRESDDGIGINNGIKLFFIFDKAM
jgi:hypothetical protein